MGGETPEPEKQDMKPWRQNVEVFDVSRPSALQAKEVPKELGTAGMA